MSELLCNAITFIPSFVTSDELVQTFERRHTISMVTAQTYSFFFKNKNQLNGNALCRIRVAFFLWWRAPQQMLRTHHSLKAFCATLWWRWAVFFYQVLQVMEHQWNEIDRWKPATRRKTCPSATLSTTNPTWTDPGSNPGLRSGRPATNRLSHGTASVSLRKRLRLYPRAIYFAKSSYWTTLAWWWWYILQRSECPFFMDHHHHAVSKRRAPVTQWRCTIFQKNRLRFMWLRLGDQWRAVVDTAMKLRLP
jgi:hypothetical protein